MEYYEIEVLIPAELNANGEVRVAEYWQLLRREDKTLEEARASVVKVGTDDEAKHAQDIQRNRLPADHVLVPRALRIVRYTRDVVA